MEELVEVTKPEKEEYLPTIWDAVKLLLLYIVFITIPQFIMEIAYAMRSVPSDPPLMSAISSLVGLMLLLLYIGRKRQAPHKNMFSAAPIAPIYYVAMAFVVIGTSIILSDFDNLLKTVLPMSPFWADLFKGLFSGSTGLWKAVLAVAVVAPVVEEVLFRGIILRGLLKHYSAQKAILVSALLFAVFHMNPWQIPVAFIAGLITAWWYVRTRSLFMCIYIHALNNSLGFIATYVLRVRIPGYNATGAFHPLWFNMLGAALLGIGIAALLRAFRHKTPESSLEA